ncbi:MAG: DUF1501 domain-containing protein, partial [Saprospiraceae bacterium]|nr:DUF1501 domain-containing protein [Saprospiraceae bacterium]
MNRRTDIDRRTFISRMKQASLAAMGATISTSPFLSGCTPTNITSSTADHVILLWMAGGMCHTETFDPKKYTPFEKGMESKGVISTFRSNP